jgi:hypothetical protein
MIKNKTQIKIPTSEKYKSWAFPIDSISIGNLTFAINKLGLLGLDSGSMIVNREIYLFLKDNIFKDFLDKHICYEEIWEEDSGANIYCSINDFPEFPLFFFNVNEGKNKIPIKISERDDREGFIDIAFNNELHNSDYIWVDKMFFYQYDVLFDYNDHTISVYVDKVVSKKCSIKKYFLFINVSILLISCIVIGYYKIII